MSTIRTIDLCPRTQLRQGFVGQAEDEFESEDDIKSLHPEP